MGIGNYYIHYHYKNYLRFGINESKGAKFQGSAVYDFQGQKAKFQSQLKRKNVISKTLLKKYEDIYSSILNPESVNLSSQEMARVQKARKLLNDYISQKYQKSLNVSVTGKPILTGQAALHAEVNKALKLKSSVLKDYEISNRALKHRATTIKNSLENVYREGQRFIAEGARQGLDTAKIQSIMKKIENSVKQIAKEKNVALPEDGAMVRSVLDACWPDGTFVAHNDLANQINALIQFLKSPMAAMSGATGEIGEYTGALTRLVYTQQIDLASADIQKELEKVWTGASSESTLSTQRITNLASLFGISKNDLLVQITQDSAQQNGNSSTKVDVIFQNGTDKDVGVSVKNYNLSSNYYIHLVSGTPFSNVLSEVPEFAAHYLNINSAHEYSLKPGKGQTKDAYIGQTTFSQYRKQANEALKLYALKSALEGFSQRGQAQYVLINDNSHSGRNSVRLIHIVDIINEVANRDISHAVSIVVNTPSMEKDIYKNIGGLTKEQLWKNEWVDDMIPNKDSAKARMAKLLGEVHKSKISVSISPDVFTKLMYGKSRFGS